VALQEYFSHPSFSYLLLSNPTHKTKIETAKRWQTNLRSHTEHQWRCSQFLHISMKGCCINLSAFLVISIITFFSIRCNETTLTSTIFQCCVVL
jgi:hypothetical protein